MDEKKSSGLYSVESDKSDTLYPMCFGVSCAFFALQLLSNPEVEDERWSGICDKMLQGSAQLLGLLVWKVQTEGANGGKCKLLLKLQTAEKEIDELKKRRHEDARANEKVVSIFAAQEQGWLNERKKLRQQIGALMNELRVLEKKKGEDIFELNEKLKNVETMLQGNDKVVEDEKQQKRELEEKLKEAEKVVEDLRETAKREAQEHSSELWKHKMAFIEVVSNQRQLEAEMGRLIRQVETRKQELGVVLKQKEEAVLMAQKMSIEMVKMQQNLEQKDKILSAMLRKSKLDIAEKQMFLKEVKLSKAKRKQAELETEKWRSASESKHERKSLRSMLANQLNSRLDVYTSARGVHPSATGSSNTGKARSQSTDLASEFGHLGLKKDRKESELSQLSEDFSLEGNEELADIKQLEGWVHSEAEKYAKVIQQRHHLELDAFAEQMRIKDEKLKTFHWQLLSMELESKRLQSHIRGLNEDMSQLRHDNMKLEALLLEQEEELTFFKEQLKSRLKCLNCQNSKSNSFLHSPAIAHDTTSPEDKIIKEKPCETEQETKTKCLVDKYQEEDTQNEETKHSNDVSLTTQSSEEELGDSKDIVIAHVGRVQERCTSPVEIDTSERLAPPNHPSDKTNSSPWRMDIHALGVSYKIKRLKQQLFMFERLAGKQESNEDTGSNDNRQIGMKGFISLMSSLNKQVGRYQFLQGKADDLCKRMHENNLNVNHGHSSIARAKEDTKALEHFLEETIQLQRYTVATGQKLLEIQSNVGSGFVEVAEELIKTANFDMKCFAESVGTLFQEVQKGLEVRISRIIGDLGGTLACEGMLHLRS
ncbi:spindle pole body component 110 isoform X2 [Juglans microcarpa x Juglans regia]|uniref:spindle pole body component 110 isoform X2 n=1 Tax=Juglans microcarpa x Juglans regia TaxID=2249226 RepID=UPI001B7E6783|nr:spindle pole body component 110 isoform X2 [Juglans microcarpa x Juglans regia]